MNKILELINVSKNYRKRIALDDVSLSIYEGELLGLIGPKGAGKTTLINIITGKTKRYKGLINKFDNKYIGYIGDKYNFYFCQTGLANLEHIAISCNVSMNEVMDIIKSLNIKIDLNKKVKTYSLGMKKKLAIIEEVIRNPKLIIFDEVTEGLTVSEMYEFKSIINKIAVQKNIAVLLADDMVSELEKMCYKIIILQKGKIQGSIDLSYISDFMNMNIASES